MFVRVDFKYGFDFKFQTLRWLFNCFGFIRLRLISFALEFVFTIQQSCSYFLKNLIWKRNKENEEVEIKEQKLPVENLPTGWFCATAKLSSWLFFLKQSSNV